MTLYSRLIATGLWLCCLGGPTGLVFAETISHSQSFGALRIEAPFARASASAAVKASAAYFTLTNTGTRPDRLIAVTGDMARRVELHNIVQTDGVMTMVRIEDGVPLAPGTSVVFEPGGMHVMMMGLHAPLIEGDMLTVTLVFEKAGATEIQIPIRKIGAKHHDSKRSRKMDHSKHGT